MSDNIDRLGLNVDDVVKGGNAAAAAFDKMAASVEKFTGVAQKVSQGGREINVVIDGYNELGQVVSLNINKITDANKEVTYSIQETTKAIDKSLEASSQAARNYATSFKNDMASLVNTMDRDVKVKMQNSIDQIGNIIRKGFDSKRFKDLWDGILGGNDVNVDTATEATIANKIRSIVGYMETQKKRALDEAASKARKDNATNIAGFLTGDYVDAGINERAKRIVDKIRQLVTDGKIEADKFQEVWEALAKNKNAVFLDGPDAMAAKYIRSLQQLGDKDKELQSIDNKRHFDVMSNINKEIAGVNQKNDAEKRELQTLRAATELAKEGAIASFGQSNRTPSLKERGNFESAIGASLTPVQAGTVNLQRYLQILEQVKTGTNRVFSDPAERQIAANITKAGDAFKSFGNEADSAFRKMQKGQVDTSYEGKKAASGILLSWQSMLRLLEVQFLHTFINRIMATLKSSVNEAIAYQKALSEIRTISQDTSLSFSDFAASTRALANSTGFALKDITEGVYETTSNQIAKGYEAVAHIAEVGDFARSTASSMADGINLLDGVLNSYNLTAGQTASVSAKMFAIIDVGRVRASEMANSIGNLTSMSSELGISIDEAGAAVARLTIQGMKYPVASTLMENLMSKLIKPTGEMKDLLHEWGFESGQAAVAALGFSGFLKKLSVEVGNNKERFGEIFNTMRGLRGVLGLTADMQKYADTVDYIRDSYERYVKAVKLSKESSGFALGAEFEKIKTFFTGEVGTSLVETLNKINIAIGGIANATKVLTSNLLSVGLGFAAFKTSSRFLTGDAAQGTGLLGGFKKFANDDFKRILTERKEIVQQMEALGAKSISFLPKSAGNLRYQVSDYEMNGLSASRIADIEKEIVKYNALTLQASNRSKNLGVNFRAFASSIAAGVKTMIGSIDWVSLGIGAAIYLYSAYQAQQEKLKTIREDTISETLIAYQKDTEAYLASQNLKFDILDEVTRKSFAGVSNYLAQQNVMYEKSIDILLAKAETATEQMKLSGKNVSDELQSDLNDLNNKITSAKNTIQKLKSENASNKSETEKKQFELFAGGEDQNSVKVLAMLQRINRLKQEANYIDNQRNQAQSLRDQATNDPANREYYLKQAQAIEEKFQHEDTQNKIKEAEALTERVNTLYTKGAKRRAELEKTLADAKVKQANDVALAEREVELDELKTTLSLMTSQHAKYTDAQIKQFQLQIKNKQNQLDSLRLSIVSDEDKKRIDDLVKSLEELNTLKAIEIKFGGTEGLQGALANLAQTLTDTNQHEIERQQKQEADAQAQKVKAEENLRQAQIVLAKMEQSKVIDAKGNFVNVEKNDPRGLSFLNDINEGNLQNLLKKGFNPEQAGQAYADWYKEQGQKVVALMDKNNPAAILSFWQDVEKKAEALRLEAAQRTAKKIAEIENRSLLDARDKLLEDNSNLRKKMDDGNKSLGEIISTVAGNVHLLTESTKDGLIPWKEYQLKFDPREELGKQYIDWNEKNPDQKKFNITDFGHGKEGFDLQAIEKNLQAAANAITTRTQKEAEYNSAYNSYAKAKNDKTLTPAELKEYEDSFNRAKSGLDTQQSLKELLYNYSGYLAAEANALGYLGNSGRGKEVITTDKQGKTTTIDDLYNTMVSQLSKIKELQKDLNKGPKDLADRQKLIDDINAAMSRYQANVQASGTAATNAANALPILIQQLDQLGVAAKKIKFQIQGFTPENHAFGGVAGSDTIPAMLTPGEMVMNRGASQAFMPLLSMLNGVGSRGLALGGSVNVGDINVNMSSTGSASTDARAIASELRTLIRQGRATL